MTFSSSIKRARSLATSKIPPQRLMAFLKVAHTVFEFVDHAGHVSRGCCYLTRRCAESQRRRRAAERGEGSRTIIPAELAPVQVAEVQRLAIEAFRAVDAAGLSRVDFLMESGTGAIYVNEINTMPGFTTISMYAKMWDASGVGYPALVDRLIDLALARHVEKQRLKASVL